MKSLKPIHWLLAIQSLVIILGSINRLSNLTIGFVAENEFLRWVDFHNMLTLPVVSLVAFYLLKKHIEYDNPVRDRYRHLGVNVAFLIGVYLLGAGYGNHEVTNYLHSRFCPSGGVEPICQIIIFNDDEFSHWVFFAGFVLINLALMLLQVLFPHKGEILKWDMALLVANGVFVSAGIFANLALEEIGVDLYIILLLTTLSLYLLWRNRQQPLLIYYSVAYSLGLVTTFIYRFLFRG
jgi:hypothetical protein